MYKIKLLLLMCFCSQLFGQNCEPDPNYIETGFYPALCYSSNGDECEIPNLIPGCYHELDIHVVVGEEIYIPTIGSRFEINFIKLETEGAFIGLPEGIEYVCDPPDCLFNQNTTNCIQVSGFPEISAQHEFKFIAEFMMFDSLIRVIDTVPGAITDGGIFEFIVTGLNDHHVTPFSVSLAPNPTQGFSNISIDSEIRNELSLQILSLTGQVLQEQFYQIEQGVNNFDLDVSNLSNGMYFYTIGNEDGVLTDRIIIAKQK